MPPAGTPLARTEAIAVAVRNRAEFQAQLARIYSWDENDIWKAATEAANECTRQCSERIAAECDKLGIRAGAAAEYQGRTGTDAAKPPVAQRRAELTKVANTRIDQHLKETIHAIQRASVEIQTQLVAEGLTSAGAKAFLESMPTPAQLMPIVTVEEIQKQLGAETEDDEDY